MTDFSELISDDEREEIEASVASINRMLSRASVLCENIVDFIDARMSDGQA